MAIFSISLRLLPFRAFLQLSAEIQALPLPVQQEGEKAGASPSMLPAACLLVEAKKGQREWS